MPPKVLFNTVETQNADNYQRYQSTQLTLVKSRLVLASALRDPKANRYQTVREQIDPIEWLQEKLKVEFVAGSEVMEISLAGKHPEEVAGLVNAVKKAYMDEVVNVDQRRRIERFDHLKKIRDTYTETLKKKRETMRKLAEAVGSDDKETLALRQQYAMEHSQYLQKELLDIKSRRRKVESQLKLLRPGEPGDSAAEPEPPTEQEVDRLVEEHPAVADLVAQLAQRQRRLEVERAKVRRISRNPDAEPSLRPLSDEVRGLTRLLARRRREVRPEAIRLARDRGTVEAGSESQGLEPRAGVAGRAAAAARGRE